jgi:magnesium-transporting ATPase (P-type)
VSGSPTESAVLAWGLKLGMNFKQIKHDASVLHIETFNSTKKRAGVVFKTSDGKVHVHWKGAAEIILDLCSSWMDSDSIVYSLTSEKVWPDLCIMCCTCQCLKTSKAAVICMSLHKFLHSCEGALRFLY